MNLIIDNGGTKAIWVFVDEKRIVKQFTTAGIYPPLADDDSLLNYFQSGNEQHEYPLSDIYFYSTGCRPEPQKDRLKKLIRSSFLINGNVSVATDVLAAARALCGHQAGIACIMGTGSNSCLYDGERVTQNRGGYGFILGDEGSGAVLGKQLVQHYLYQTLPTRLLEELIREYSLSVEEILLNVYQNKAPNKYLASFAPFIFKHKEDAFIAQILDEQFKTFFQRCVMVYDNYQQLPIHFLGSIAFHFKEEIKRAADDLSLRLQSVIQDPVPGLVEFHGEKV